MKETIGRNEPCPCGSGKKYKKCCGANEAVSITHVLESEIDNLQKKLLYFALDHYEDEVYMAFEEYQEHFSIEDDAELEFYQFVHSIWYSLFFELEDDETILEKFIHSEIGKIKRPKLKQILQSWTEPKTIAGEIVNIENNVLTVVDGFSSKSYESIVTNAKRTFEKGSFFIGILLPFEKRYVFFPAPFDLPDLPLDQAIDHIKKKSLFAEYHSPQEFLTDFFMEIMKDLTMIGGLVDADSMEWQSPVYKEVVELLKQQMESLGEIPPFIDLGIILWYQFCQKKQKKIKNPNLYAASLHYLLSTFNNMASKLTQKEIAKLYNVSVGSLSSAYRELDDVLEDEINRIIEISYEEDKLDNSITGTRFNKLQGPLPTEQAMQEALAEIQEQNLETIEEINDYLNKKPTNKDPKKASSTKKGQAQQLIYEAMETQGAQRYILAEKALNLDPNCVDAYVILAENASDPEEAMMLSKKGMEIGKKELGKAFIKDNKGYFWGLLETRPYMRAKATYAQIVYELGYEMVAIKEYEELLELNPNDNQGIRYELLPVYLETGNFFKAEKLLRQYEEDSAHGLYNKLLIELFKNGFSPKSVKLLKDAKKQNPHVIPYLSGKKRIPMHLPDYYGWGDKNEAIIYADNHFHLWRKIEGLQQWIKKN